MCSTSQGPCHQLLLSLPTCMAPVGCPVLSWQTTLYANKGLCALSPRSHPGVHVPQPYHILANPSTAMPRAQEARTALGAHPQKPWHNVHGGLSSKLRVGGTISRLPWDKQAGGLSSRGKPQSSLDCKHLSLHLLLRTRPGCPSCCRNQSYCCSTILLSQHTSDSHTFNVSQQCVLQVASKRLNGRTKHVLIVQLHLPGG